MSKTVTGEARISMKFDPIQVDPTPTPANLPPSTSPVSQAVGFGIAQVLGFQYFIISNYHYLKSIKLFNKFPQLKVR